MLLIVCLNAPSVAAQDARRAPGARKDAQIGVLLDSIGKTRTPLSAAISPDGKTVAWTVEEAHGRQIHLTEVAHPDSTHEKTVRVGPGTTACDSADPVWSPDGAWIAFRSTCTRSGDGQAEVFVWSMKTGDAKELTQIKGGLEALSWSPDGKRIGFLFVENATRSAGALAAMKPWAGVIGEDGVEVQRVGVVDVASRSFAQVTPTGMHVYEFDWAPNGKQMAYVAANAPGENNWWVAQMYVQAVQMPGMQTLNAGPTGEFAPRSVVDTAKLQGGLHGLQLAVPRWSPDGTQIAFIGGLMSDQGSTGGDVYVVPAAGGEPKDVTPERRASVAAIRWYGNGQIGLAEHVGGSSHLALLDLSTGRDADGVDVTFPETIGAGGAVMAISIAARGEGEVAFIRSSFERAPEVWAGSLSDLKQMTHLNDGVHPMWGKTESIDWSSDGKKVQGWLLYPTGWTPNDVANGKKYPLLVSVHGGPSSAVTPRWPNVGYGGVPFSALGYFVFMPNPRGSYGQGEAFTQANVKDFGYGDLRDVLKGMDVLEQRFPIDTKREGLTGWSYGGFMTMFGVTQTTRFHAAVAGAGISDWKSYYGQNSIDQWMVPFFGGTVYDDPAVYAKSSAIEYIKKVKTPTLVVVGDRDGECPAPQSFEFWHALRAEGVKTQLVVYPNEGHSFQDPVHRRDVLERAVAWFDREMPGE
jgi:dipeptidyl aminopeptidase/acylaminoacyl peptidase